jgi:hypothetical protein
MDDWVKARVTVTENGCWIWNGAKVGKGYGKLKVRGWWWLAHRFMYACYVDPIPEGHVVRHKCHNPPCVNPDHLQTGTPRENVYDQIERGTLNPPYGECKPIEYYRKRL